MISQADFARIMAKPAPKPRVKVLCSMRTGELALPVGVVFGESGGFIEVKAK